MRQLVLLLQFLQEDWHLAHKPYIYCVYLSCITDKTFLGLDYINMSNTAGVLKKHELLTLSERMGSPPVFDGVHVAYHLSCLCCVVFVLVMCLVYPMLPVSLNVPFLVPPLIFSNVYLFINRIGGGIACSPRPRQIRFPVVSYYRLIN